MAQVCAHTAAVPSFPLNSGSTDGEEGLGRSPPLQLILLGLGLGFGLDYFCSIRTNQFISFYLLIKQTTPI